MWKRARPFVASAIAYAVSSMVAGFMLLIGLVAVAPLTGPADPDPDWFGEFARLVLLLGCVFAVAAVPPALLAHWGLRRAKRLSPLAFAGIGGGIGCALFAVFATLALSDDTPGDFSLLTSPMLLFGVVGPVSIVAGVVAGLAYHGIYRTVGRNELPD